MLGVLVPRKGAMAGGGSNRADVAVDVRSPGGRPPPLQGLVPLDALVVDHGAYVPLPLARAVVDRVRSQAEASRLAHVRALDEVTARYEGCIAELQGAYQATLDEARRRRDIERERAARQLEAKVERVEALQAANEDAAAASAEQLSRLRQELTHSQAAAMQEVAAQLVVASDEAARERAAAADAAAIAAAAQHDAERHAAALADAQGRTDALQHEAAALRAELADLRARLAAALAAPSGDLGAAIGWGVDGARRPLDLGDGVAAAVLQRLQQQPLTGDESKAGTASAGVGPAAAGVDKAVLPDGDDDGVETPAPAVVDTCGAAVADDADSGIDSDTDGAAAAAGSDDDGGQNQSTAAARAAATTPVPAAKLPAVTSRRVATSTPTTDGSVGAKAAAAAGGSSASSAAAGAGHAAAASAGKVKQLEGVVKELRAKLRQLEAASAAATKPAPSGGGGGGGVDEKTLRDAVERSRSVLERKWRKGAYAGLLITADSRWTTTASARRCSRCHRFEGHTPTPPPYPLPPAEREEADKEARREADAAARRLAKAAAELDAAHAALAEATAQRAAADARLAALAAVEAVAVTLRASAAEAARLAAELAAATARAGDLERLYRDEAALRKRYWNALEDAKGKIRVYVRARPMSRDEATRGDDDVVTFPDDSTVEVAAGSRSRRGGDATAAVAAKSFVFDRVFGGGSSQGDVFADVEALVQSAVDGYNVSIFAYGQTGRCVTVEAGGGTR